jgi:hypothetical protein
LHQFEFETALRGGLFIDINKDVAPSLIPLKPARRLGDYSAGRGKMLQEGWFNPQNYIFCHRAYCKPADLTNCAAERIDLPAEGHIKPQISLIVPQNKIFGHRETTIGRKKDKSCQKKQCPKK